VTRKARRISVCVSLGVIPFGAATVALVGKAIHVRQVSTTDAIQQVDAAFRDGFYLGRLDAKDARKARPSLGRWNDARDRASFLAGYQQGYEEARATKTASYSH
jgi:hypothetical protein